MTPAHFPPRLRQLARLERWAVMPTLSKDYVASHSFFVAIYAFMIFDLLERRDLLRNVNPTRLLLYALLHDVEEAVTGDVYSGLKAGIVDKDKYLKHAVTKMVETMPSITLLQGRYVLDVNGEIGDDVAKIVKAADRLDAALFCASEMATGNAAMRLRYKHCKALLEEAWHKLPGEPAHLAVLWHDFVVPSLAEHTDPAAYDLQG